MAEYQFLGVSTEEKICTLTISNPPANLLSKAVLTELDGFLDGLGPVPEPKVLILTGAGTFFIVGADIKEISELKNSAQGTEAATLGQRVFNKLENLPIPTIAAINGHCLGGGNEMAMSCSIRIASDRARIGQPEINLGIMPGFGGTQRLARIVGKAKALELNLTGEMLNAKEAFEIGLVNRLVPEAEVMKQAMGLAKKIASKSRPAVEGILKATREGLGRPLEEGLKLEAALFGQLCETSDMREGLKSFLEKRQPKFQDR
ncbi:MAG: enoyl-CoA hydratase/isomerase family protein [Candidatus Omnitrophica bacterium]|nr:enoyl-CoA hydratase/isomerase family protein [Candidatus Omnitrophota bacterium]